MHLLNIINIYNKLNKLNKKIIISGVQCGHDTRSHGRSVIRFITCVC